MHVQAVLANWSPDFMVSLMSGVVLPGIGVGVLIAAMVWLLGYMVNSLFKLLVMR